MIECKQTKSIVIAVDGTLDNFSNWLAELNAFTTVQRNFLRHDLN